LPLVSPGAGGCVPGATARANCACEAALPRAGPHYGTLDGGGTGGAGSPRSPSHKKSHTPVGLATAGGLAEISAGVLGTAATWVKGAHRVRVQIGVCFQRRGFRSPIRARSRESESKGESDLLWTRESESK
jgi:hypothetical protein